MDIDVASVPEWPLWSTNRERGLRLEQAGPRIWLDEDLLQDLIECMPLFPNALVSTDFTGCPKGHYEPGDSSVGAVLRFNMADGTRRVYRIIRYDLMRRSYEARWPD